MLYRIFWSFFTLSLMGSVLACMILLVKNLFKTKFSARWHYYVWALLLIRLIIPFAPEHDLSIFNLFKPVVEWVNPQYSASEDNKTNAALVPDIAMPTIPSTPAAGLESPPVTNVPGTIETYFSLEDVIGLLWIAGILIMAFAVIGANFRFSLRLRKRVQYQDAVTISILDSCRKKLGIKTSVPILLDPKIASPLLFGLIRPVILTSKDMIQKLSDEEKRYVFLHELTHYKRKDIFVNWITAIIKCVYWFNPILWYACLRIKEDCEFSCDESVLGLLDPIEYKRYGQTILSLVNTRGKSVTLTCTTGIAGRKSSIKRRIYMIAGFKKKTIAWTLTAIVLTLLVGCSALTGAKTDASPLPGQSGNDQKAEGSGTINDKNDQNNVKTEVPTSVTGGGTVDPMENGIAMVIIDPNQEDQKDKIDDAYNKMKAGQTVVYNEQGDITAFVIYDINLIQKLQEDGMIKFSTENLKKLQEQKGAFAYFSDTGVMDEKMKQLVDNAVRFYIDKLKDKSYTGTYGDGFTWYTAAEELGKIGKPAIPSLIEKLSTTDDYERALALYALLLATQQENVKSFTGGEYINVNLDFDPANHPAMIKTAMEWWEKYKSNF